MNGPDWVEKPIVFDCEGCQLLGIATVPERPVRTGVLIVVGGPQYRAGSHRQFTLLARYLVEHGIPSFRFDYRGMGDSEGDFRNFEVIDDDIRSAVNVFQAIVPGVETIALWGLCDAASAALYYANTDTRVHRLILLNPWVHTPATAAKARLNNYYLKRLFQVGFWYKLMGGKLRMGESTRDILSAARGGSVDIPSDPRHGSAGYVERMCESLSMFRGHVQILLSGNDLTAQEFEHLSSTNVRWKRAIGSKRVTRHRLVNANHTFSTDQWRSQVASWTLEWVDEAGEWKRA